MSKGKSEAEKRQILKGLSGEELFVYFQRLTTFYNPLDTEDYDLAKSEVLERLRKGAEHGGVSQSDSLGD